VFCEPDVGFDPLQLPEAVQDVAFVADQFKVLLPPPATDVGDAVSDTVGSGVAGEDDTATVTLAWREPPGPAQFNTYVGLVVSAAVLSVPEVAFDPLQLPDAVQEVAFVELQVSVLLPPLLTDIGDADNETVGAGVEPPETVTITLSDAVRPLALVHLSVYVPDAFNAPVLWLPEVAFCPLQAPDAVHETARELDQLKMLLPPVLTELGLADSETVGLSQNCAWAGEAIPQPNAAKRPASATGANRIVVFMGGDHSHNATNNVCLQFAT
jgi:hypothetical protein